MAIVFSGVFVVLLRQREQPIGFPERYSNHRAPTDEAVKLTLPPQQQDVTIREGYVPDAPPK